MLALVNTDTYIISEEMILLLECKYGYKHIFVFNMNIFNNIIDEFITIFLEHTFSIVRLKNGEG